MKIILILMPILLFGCRHEETRTINIYFSSTETMEIKDYHFQLSVDNNYLLDTAIKNSGAYGDVLVKSLSSLKEHNTIKIKVNAKTKFIRLDSLKGKVINIYLGYNRVKLRDMHYKYSNNREGKPHLDYMQFIDSLQMNDVNYGKGRYDSLRVSIIKN